MMKKIIIATVFLAYPTITVAAGTAVTGAMVIEPFYRLICEVLSRPFIPVSLAVLVWALAGAKWLISQDDDEQRMLAKDMVVYVLVGLIILITNKTLIKIIFRVDICP
ncbi:MAG: hypothetical protein ABH834_05655 [Candidatus Altiarchaeota archaeon]